MAPLQRAPAIRRGSPGRSRQLKRQPEPAESQPNENAEYKYEAYHVPPKSPHSLVLNGRIGKSAPPQSPLGLGTTRSGRRYSPPNINVSVSSRQEVPSEYRYPRAQYTNTRLGDRITGEANAETEVRDQAYGQDQPQRKVSSRPSFASPGLSSTPLRRRRLSRARALYLSDPKAKPVIHAYQPKFRPTSTSISSPRRPPTPIPVLYHSHTTDPISKVRSPHRSKFLAHQASLDNPYSPTDTWATFGRLADLPLEPHRAYLGMIAKDGGKGRVERDGASMRLLERRETLDALSVEEQRELVEWWLAKYGPKDSVQSAGGSSRGSSRKSGKSAKGGWAGQIWEFVKQRRWRAKTNTGRREKSRGRPWTMNRQEEMDVEFHGSVASAESWRRDMAAAAERTSLRSRGSDRTGY